MGTPGCGVCHCWHFLSIKKIDILKLAVRFPRYLDKFSYVNWVCADENFYTDIGAIQVIKFYYIIIIYPVKWIESVT